MSTRASIKRHPIHAMTFGLQAAGLPSDHHAIGGAGRDAGPDARPGAGSSSTRRPASGGAGRRDEDARGSGFAPHPAMRQEADAPDRPRKASNQRDPRDPRDVSDGPR